VLSGERSSELVASLEAHAVELSERRAGVLVLGEGAEVTAALPAGIVAAALPKGVAESTLELAVDGLFERLALHHRDLELGAALERYRYELRELVDIARALTQERDIDRLLSLILAKSRFITGADAGSIYVLEGNHPDPEERKLRFKLSQNDSCQFESSEFTMPVSTRSIAGYAVVTKDDINLPDVHDIPADAPYAFDGSFDLRVGYHTRSMITVPLVSAEDEVIGVIQLINKKRTPSERLLRPEDFEREVVPFDARSETLLHTLASQAGIALENALLYDEIRLIFEGFVRASVQAIEQRDPTTSGHSLRVSVLSCQLARVVDRASDGPYGAVRFTPREIKELEYASLLHDFGKIGVREQVLVKAKKLYPHELAAVQSRIHYAIKAAEADALRRKVELIEAGAGRADLDALDEGLAERRERLAEAYRIIAEANEPTVLSEGDFTRIAELGAFTFVDGTGAEQRLLSPDEVRSLQVRRGSLNEAEMQEIRSHVVHTFAFLSRIPWGKSFHDIPQIAGAHHEKLDGSGYPHGMKAEAIPLQAKIMTIADIFDALTARDRPYKKAMPVSRALDILGFEVKSGGVDGELVRLFTEAEVFKELERELTY
jgi:HD-GYP domain-containing protein (c-di-GMP phosphodiesterase class II)